MALDISEMTYIISGISEQTKILALNAAIEAARAGDAGRGFSVVSTEIRSLAESVGRSASRIEDLVSGVQATSDSSSRPRNGRRNSPGVDGEEAEQLHRGMEGFKTS